MEIMNLQIVGGQLKMNSVTIGLLVPLSSGTVSGLLWLNGPENLN